MDLSSSATQRSTTSEALSIQPGSVRVTTAVAANEFARHLAENARSDASRRRDDRSQERAERAAERPREARDEKQTESRKAADENETASEEVSRKKVSDSVSALQLTEETDATGEAVEAAPEEALSEVETTGTTEQTSAEAPAAETSEETDKELQEAGPAEAATPETAEDEAVLAEGDTGAVTETPAGESEAVIAAPVDAAAVAPRKAATDVASEEAMTVEAATPDKPRAQTAANRPAETAGPTDDAAANTPDAKPAEETKPAKGLGQEAAEQLAGKKADAKQANDLPKAALQAVQQMAQQILRAAAPQAQRAPLVSAPLESGSTGRALDMPASGLPQSSNANGTAATVRIGTLPGQSQPTQVPSAAIALQMARNLQKGISRFEIRLDPPEMGRIDVRMEIRKDGQVVAHMSVERPETLDLLQRDAKALQQALNNAGLQADGDSLNFSLKDGQDDASGRAFADGGNAGGTADSEEDAPMLPIYNVNLAADGGVDIRV